MNLENYIKNMPPELQEKACACGSVEELLALAREAKIPVPDKALEAIAGGDDPDSENCGKEKCPSCGSTDITVLDKESFGYCIIYYLKCNNCGNKWTETDWID